mgnify:CR=1 FL=1
MERENTFTMEKFSKSVNEFLEFRKYDILKVDKTKEKNYEKIQNLY